MLVPRLKREKFVFQFLYLFLVFVRCLLDQSPKEVGKVVAGKLDFGLQVVASVVGPGVVSLVAEPLQTFAHAIHLVTHHIQRP